MPNSRTGTIKTSRTKNGGNEQVWIAPDIRLKAQPGNRTVQVADSLSQTWQKYRDGRLAQFGASR